MLNVCAILFATTVYSSAPFLLNLQLFVPALSILYLFPRPGGLVKNRPPRPVPSNSNDQTSAESDEGKKTLELPFRGFLTTYRGSMMVVTCVAILAVDFRVFPRRFAKTENWGTSLMDVGVGAFVFSAGVVSARSILKSSPAVKGRQTKSFSSRIISSVRHSLPLLALGLVRLYSVKGLDYAEHVTEYGVHWNFFFTLALLPPFVELSDSMVYSFLSHELLGILLATIYQVLLDNTDLKAYILVRPRGPDLLSKNREGVFSFIGYLSIFLAGRGLGAVVIPRSNTPLDKKDVNSKVMEVCSWQARKSLLLKLMIRTVLYTLLCVCCTAYIGLRIGVSRRLANLPYILWVNALNSGLLLSFCLIETICFPEAYQRETATSHDESTSKIMRAFNRNGLGVFLVANLLTGLVNLSINTLDVHPLTAMAVMIGYVALVTGLAMGLDTAGIKLKI